MNERIRELAEQAGLKVNADGEIGPAYFGSVDAGYRKFAELIAQECAGIAYEYDIPNLTGPGEFIGNRIKKHFGVEE